MRAICHRKRAHILRFSGIVHLLAHAAGTAYAIFKSTLTLCIPREHILNKLNVLLYAARDPPLDGPSNVSYFLSNALAKETNLTYFPFLKAARRRYLGNVLTMYRDLILTEFDIVHFLLSPTLVNGSYVALQFATRRGCTTVLNVHGILELERMVGYSRRIPLMSKLYTMGACKAVDNVVVNSRYMRYAVSAWYGVDLNKIVVIPNGVDLKRFSQCENDIKLEGDPRILYVGRLSNAKGVDILIRALAKVRTELPNVRLHLVGSLKGAPAYSYQVLARKLRVEENVVFHEWASPENVPNYYKATDICVFPSRFEGFGIVVLEAMASGVPVITSNIDSFQEILSDGLTGLLFKSGDPRSLAEVILRLCGDAALRRKLSQAASQAVKTYSWENIAERYISLYNNLLVGVSNTK